MAAFRPGRVGGGVVYTEAEGLRSVACVKEFKGVVGYVIGNISSGQGPHLSVLEHDLEVVVAPADGESLPEVLHAGLRLLGSADMPLPGDPACVTVFFQNLCKRLVAVEVSYRAVALEGVFRPAVVEGGIVIGKGRQQVVRAAVLVDEALVEPVVYPVFRRDLPGQYRGSRGGAYRRDAVEVFVSRARRGEAVEIRGDYVVVPRAVHRPGALIVGKYEKDVARCFFVFAHNSLLRSVVVLLLYHMPDLKSILSKQKAFR